MAYHGLNRYGKIFEMFLTEKSCAFRLVQTDCVKHSKIENSLTGCVLYCVKSRPTLLHFTRQITQV